MHPTTTLAQWSTRLRHAAGDIRVTAAELTEFRDDAGHRRRVDPLLLAHTFVLPAPSLDPATFTEEPWLRLWSALLDSTIPITNQLVGTGPLFPHLHDRAIEVWTEGELAGLHALWHLAARNPALAPRARSAAAWLIAELQPDNATQRPWAIHAFAQLAAEGDIEADMYAQTLLLNAIAGREKPDRFSAAILLNAANYLSALPAPPAMT
ncbi:MAG TPA: hypothetical protein VK157_09715 [Phycisphaerales bacterium]|nr:hypothetical protein [Phycisphaerales bacterium]